jgi:mRNA-degrading endonuclease RelE of RelBE toxin-antitoxin system
VTGWLRNLPPDPKRRVRARRLKDWSAGRETSNPLRSELEGFYRLRIGGYRIVCRMISKSVIQLEYTDTCDVVYEAFRQLRLLMEMDD